MYPTMEEEGIYSITPSTPNINTIIESIVHVHAACILNDNTLATFLPPLSFDEMVSDWKNNFLSHTVEGGDRLILVSVSRVDSRSTSTSTSTSTTPNIILPFEKDRPWPTLPQSPSSLPTSPNLEISGVISLLSPPSQTGPFRGLVYRLLVSPFHRRKSLARHLMTELERRALEMGRWSLMLDTTVGTPAELVYPRLGWNRLGVVKEYGISPLDGRLCDEVWFWKDLRRKEGGNRNE